MGFFSSIKNLFSSDDSTQEEVVQQAQEAAPELDEAERERLTVALREADPRLSSWLAVVLDGVDEADPLLWARLRFFFAALDAPSDEADAFITDFSQWLAMMEYTRLDEFRSELQYRLALALEMEDEEDERSRLMQKFSEGLSKTREAITGRLDALTSGHTSMDDAFWEELEEILITSDVGFDGTVKLVENLKARARRQSITDPGAIRELLTAEMAEMFKAGRRIAAVNPPEVVMMVGVNGVGKTTTIAKLAHRARMQGKKVLVAAGDTFRAAAIGQLQSWAERVGADFHSKGENADPAAVAYEAVSRGVEEGYDIIFLDTAGRLQTKKNLMEELTKIRRVAAKVHPGAPHRSILVVDGTTGQNALSQTKLFDEATGVDELIVTKLDGTSKGGIMLAIATLHDIPITYVGLGEKMEDLRPFDGESFAQALLQKA